VSISGSEEAVAEEKTKGIVFLRSILLFGCYCAWRRGSLSAGFSQASPAFLEKFEYAHISLPIAVLIWIMIYPMMMKVDFQSIKNVGKNPLGLLISTGTSWLIKPFLMFGLASFFFYNVSRLSYLPIWRGTMWRERFCWALPLARQWCSCGAG